MKAWVQHQYGDADTLELANDLVARTPKDDEVLVKVDATGLNAADVHQMTGTPFLIRLVSGLRRPKVPALGTDFAGVVEAVGSAVSHVKVGDAVMGEVSRGALAEWVTAPGKGVVRMPASCSPVEAAALPMGALTALAAVRDVADVHAGDRVLVNGGSGGVGVYAVQMAVALGAKVTAVCSGRNAELMRSLGAVDVIDYEVSNFTDTTERYDVIIDIVSTQPVARCRDILTRNGRYAVVGAKSKGSVMGMGQQIRATMASPFVSQSLRMVMAKSGGPDLETVKQLVDDGSIRPVVGTVYAFEDAADAVRHVHGGHASGKVVVRVSGSSSTA
jgi:NADPH:quinone reductase-like Zn-dependent oxidoreductase